MSGLTKNTMILSNFNKQEIFSTIDPKYQKRLKRRCIWANIGSDPWLLSYLRPNFKEFEIEPKLILFHFWFKILKIQSSGTWEKDLLPKVYAKKPSYADFCKQNNLKIRINDLDNQSHKNA